MIDYSYTECTSACMRALHEFSHLFPEYQEERVRKALDSGARFLRQKQESDGSWIGSWGVCFTYGTWFGIEGLISGGISADDRAIKQACSFLLEKQSDRLIDAMAACAMGSIFNFV